MYLTDAQLKVIEWALEEAGQFGKVILVRDRHGLRYVEVIKSLDLKQIEKEEEEKHDD